MTELEPDTDDDGRDAADSDAQPVRHLAELLSYRISVLNRAFEQEAGRNLARRHELSLTEARVLGILEQHAAATVKHLGQLMRLKRPQVSRTLTVLRERGLVDARQNPADGRSTYYAVTPAGRRRARRILRVASQIHHRRIAVLTPQERAALDRALDKLLSETEGPDEP